VLPDVIWDWFPVLVTLVVALTARVILVRVILPRFAAHAGVVGRNYLRRVDAASLVIVSTLTAKALFRLYEVDQSFTFGSLLLIGCSVYIAVETLKSFLIDYHVIHRLGKPVPRLLVNVGEVVLFGVLFVSLGGLVTSINLTPFLATSAVLSAIIGLAMQDTLGSLFSGLALQADMPFRPGDWVEIQGSLGEVVEVTWRSTKLRTRRNELIVLPNSQVAKAVICNYSLPSKPAERNLVIGLGYDHQPNLVKERLMAAVAGVPGVLGHPVGDVRVLEFTEYKITYQIVYWIDDFEGDLRIAARVRAAIWYACKRHGMEVPLPIQTVTLRQEAVPPKGDAQAIVDAVAGVDFLKPLPVEDRIALASQMHQELWGAGERVFSQGDAGDSLYIVMSGGLRVERQHPDGQSDVLGTLGAGDVVGEVSLLTGDPRTATVVCEVDSVLLSLDKAAFQPALAAHPELLATISQIIAQRQEANDVRSVGTGMLRDAEAAAEDRSQRLLGRIRHFFNLA
jgi:small-conductance mechanosensitive channel/CRP-like cAMP-binding protein